MPEINLVYLPYVDNLLSYYRKFVSLPGFVLLQSSDKMGGRYDILTAYPYEHIECSEKLNSYESIFNEIEQKIGKAENSCDLPFQGGAIGFFSYDLACHMAGLTVSTLPALKDLPLLYLGFYDWALIVDHKLKKIVLFAANTQNSTTQIVNEIIEIWKSPTIAQNKFLCSNLKALISKEGYMEAFYKIKKDIFSGRCYQVNLTQPFSLDYEGNCWDIYESTATKNPVSFAAFMPIKNKHILSFSPERFLQLKQQQLLSSPIKGTSRRGKTASEDKFLYEQLENCSKNRAENVMIVDLLRNDLGKISHSGTISVPSLCKIESFAEIHHLVSHVVGKCKESISPIQAFAACFPGGSITGAPKIEAMRVIFENEMYSRGIYCGSIGYFSRHGRFDTNIAIRTIIGCESNLYLSAGGGLVMDSTCEDEYTECLIKINSIVSKLASFETAVSVA